MPKDSSSLPDTACDLVDLLVCPETHQALHRASEEEREQWSTISTEELLITADGVRAYPIRDGLPHIVASEAIQRP